MAEGAAVAVIAGTAFAAYGQHKSAKAKKEAAEAMAYAKRLQADELIRRSEFNIDELQAETKKFKETQAAAFVRGGVDISSGVSLLQLEQINRDLFDEIALQREEAAYKAMMLRAGADVDLNLAGDIEEAGKYQTAGTISSGAGKVFSMT